MAEPPMPDAAELTRLRERQYQLAEHQHAAGLKIERATVLLEGYAAQLDRIEAHSAKTSERVQDHSDRITVLDGAVAVLKARKPMSGVKAGAMVKGRVGLTMRVPCPGVELTMRVPCPGVELTILRFSPLLLTEDADG